MVTWYYRSVFDDLEDLRQYREWLARQMERSGTAALLPAGSEPAAMLLPVRQRTFRAGVSGNRDEVVVTATDMADGITKEDITLTLISSRALEIRCGRTKERIAGDGRYLRDERTSWSLVKLVRLPVPVTGEGSFATFRDGVLVVRLKTTAREPKRKIPIS